MSRKSRPESGELRQQEDSTGSEGVLPPPLRQQLAFPAEFDVTCGRGRAIQEHPGNRLLRQLVDLHRSRYEQEGRQGKQAIGVEIVKAIARIGTTHPR